MYLIVPFLATFLLALSLTWVVRSVARVYGIVAAPRQDRWHSRPTALLGGCAIYASFALGCLVFGFHLSGAKLILLDNFDLAQMRAAVELTAGRAELEASGGIALQTVRAIAETGVHRISIGGLTKDVQAIDLSMRFAR